jgi:tetratricopeptide (TPR) repeat protein
MKRTWTYNILIFFISIAVAEITWCGEIADSKINNGKLLAKKATSLSGSQREEYVYKAMREFERALSAEPENPLPYYWVAVLNYYLEKDSSEAAKNYNRALKYSTEATAGLPSPWSYKSDEHLLSALDDDFSWAEAKEIQPVKEEIVEAPVEEQKVDSMAVLKEMIFANDLQTAGSIYEKIKLSPDYKSNPELTYSGLLLKLREPDAVGASMLMTELTQAVDKKSKLADQAVSAYDSVLEAEIIKARQTKREGNIASAKEILAIWEPANPNPQTPGRGRLMLAYSSILLENGEIDAADSVFQNYRISGYDKNASFKELKKQLETALKQQEEAAAPIEAARAESPEKPPQTSAHVAISPPEGDIVKIVINRVDPTSGKPYESEIWETYAPRELTAGEAYKLTINKKSERKAPKYIAIAGILTTLLIMR